MKQSEYIIKDLEREIEIVKLAQSIIDARIKERKDRIQMDIHDVINEIKKLNHLDDASIYCVLVSHRN